MSKKWDGKTKTTENLTFTLHYADGTSAEIDRGVLFSIDDQDKMHIHIGVSKVWELFGVARCLTQVIADAGLAELFNKYCTEKFVEDGK